MGHTYDLVTMDGQALPFVILDDNYRGCRLDDTGEYHPDAANDLRFESWTITFMPGAEFRMLAQYGERCRWLTAATAWSRLPPETVTGEYRTESGGIGFYEDGAVIWMARFEGRRLVGEMNHRTLVFERR